MIALRGTQAYDSNRATRRDPRQAGAKGARPQDEGHLSGHKDRGRTWVLPLFSLDDSYDFPTRGPRMSLYADRIEGLGTGRRLEDR